MSSIYTAQARRMARLALHLLMDSPGEAVDLARAAAVGGLGNVDEVITIAQRSVRLGDPQDCTDSADTLAMNHALYDCLVKWGPSGDFQPALAESWTVSDDCKTWTFKMRPGIRFTNGESCDAEAAAYSLRRMARPDIGATLGAPAVWGQYLINSIVEVLGPLTVSITTVLPIADLLDIVAAGPILPPRALETPGGPESFAAHPIGTGPWMVVAYRPGVELLLAPNPNCWHTESRSRVGLRWVAIEAAEDRLAALLSGKVDIATRLTRDSTEHASDVAAVEILENTAYIFLLASASEGGMRTEVRRALNLAVDRDEIIQNVLGGDGRPLYSAFSPVHLGGLPLTGEPCANSLPAIGGAAVAVPPLAERQAQARTLLAEAGHPDGLTLKVDCPTSLPDEGVALTELVANQLAKIGVELEVNIHEDRTAYANRVRLSEVGDMCVFDSSPLSTFRVIHEKLDDRTEGSWWLGYKNERLNAIVDEASKTAPLAQRRAMYEEAVRVLREDPPWLTLYHHTTFVGMRVAIGGTPDMVAEGKLVGSDGILDVRRLPIISSI